MDCLHTTISIGLAAPFRALHLSDSHICRADARDGHTLAMIAERFGTTMRALLERNPNLTPNDFTNGQAFCV